jgi:hypothetical protein
MTQEQLTPEQLSKAIFDTMRAKAIKMQCIAINEVLKRTPGLERKNQRERNKLVLSLIKAERDDLIKYSVWRKH